MDDFAEYIRIKELIHMSPLSENNILLNEIKNYKERCKSKKLYFSLVCKYKWHRVYCPKNIPIGKPNSEWSNSQTPLVSVIVPNYCHAPYLKERIECILNQLFKNFELIILDDGSTDNSKEIILNYKDHPKVSHIVFNKENTGNTFLQWKKGVNIAKGKYIWIAESDDYADESFLDSVMAIFSLYPDCALVKTGSYQVNEKGRILRKDWDLWKEDETIRYYPGLAYIRHNMLYFNYIYNASMLVFRKDFFQKIDKSYQQLRYTGDWLCWIEMLNMGPICEYRRKLNYFRQHNQKVSVHSQNTGRGIVDIITVQAYIMNHIHLSMFRKMMYRGELYHFYKRWFIKNDDPINKEKCDEILRTKIHTTLGDYWFYKVLSIFDFLPFIPSSRNSRYK